MPSREASPSLEVLERGKGFGGNNLLVPLQCCDLLLQDKTGARVVGISEMETLPRRARCSDRWPR